MYKLIDLKYLFKERKLQWYLAGEIKGKIRVIRHLTDPPFKDYCFGTSIQAKIVEDLYENIDIEKMDESYVFADEFQKDEDVWKIIFPRIYMKNKVRIEVEKDFKQLIAEADVSIEELVMKDKKIYSSVKIVDGMIEPCEDFDLELPMAFFDLETDDRPQSVTKSKYKEFAKPDTCDILSYSIFTPKGDKIKFNVAKDEDNKKQFMLELKADLYKYIRLEAWNGEGFDYKMLKGVFKRFDIPFNLSRFYTLDSMKMHEMLNPKERKFLALDSIAKKYLDMAKVRHTESFYTMYQNQIKGVNNLLEVYNNRDVEIMAKLEEKFGFGGVVMETAQAVGCLPQRYTYARKPSQILIRRNSMSHVGKRFVWKSKSEIPERVKFMGATVQDPIMGRWKNVIGIDLASLYNLIIQTFNISPEQLRIFRDQEPLFHITRYDDGTKIGRYEMSDGEKLFIAEPIPIYPHDYKRYDQDGIVRTTLQTVEIRRNEFKKMRDLPNKSSEHYKLWNMKQAGEKEVLLSTYGGLGARGSTIGKEGGQVSGRKEFYDYYCADDVTRFARIIIHMAKLIIQAMGYKVIYGDTDSIYIWLGDQDYTIEQVKVIVKDMLVKINAKYKEWMTELGVPTKWQKITMEAQGYYSPFIVFDKKKNYVARELWNGENDKEHPSDHVEVYGKGLKPFKPTATDFHKRFLKELYIMALTYVDPLEMDKFIQDNVSGVLDGTLDHELVFEKKLSKNISEYSKGMTADVVYAKKLIEAGKLQEKGAIYFKYGYMDDKKIQCIDEFSKTSLTGRNYFVKKHVHGDVNEIMNILIGVWDRKDVKPKLLTKWQDVLHKVSLDEWF